MEHDRHIIKVATALKEHIVADDKFQDMISDDVKNISEDVKSMRENHLVHMQGSMESLDKEVLAQGQDINKLGTSLAAQDVDIAWLKKLSYLVLAAVIGGIVTQIFK